MSFQPTKFENKHRDFNVPIICTVSGSTDENITVNFIYYIEACCELFLTGRKKLIRQLNHDFKSKNPNAETKIHEAYFNMNFYDNSDVLESTTTCTYSSNKQVKFYSTHQLPLYIPYQTNNHYGFIYYED